MVCGTGGTLPLSTPTAPKKGARKTKMSDETTELVVERDTSFGGLMTERSGLVAQYNAICDQIAGVPSLYAELEELAGKVAAVEAEISDSAAADGAQLAGFTALQKPVKVQVVTPQVKVSEARTARLRWIMTQGRPITAADFEDTCKQTGREGKGNAYSTLSLYFRDGYLTDNDARGESDRAFSVNTKNAHVRSWLGLDA